MGTIIFLILSPILAAILLLMAKGENVIALIVKVSVTLITVVSIILAVKYFNAPDKFYLLNSDYINLIILLIELAITLFIIGIGIKEKKYLVSLLSLTQAALMIGYELITTHKEYHFDHHLFIDKLSIIMVLIIAIIGGSICIFSTAYMKDFHHHHKEIKDRRNIFFPILFIFLSAMFGIVLSNDLTWIYLFWEVTTLCSFLLISYTSTEEARNNGFLALKMNLIGGLAFALAIVYLGIIFGINELRQLIQVPSYEFTIIFPAVMLGIAGLSKSAQLPFSKWLLGAMVAPSPVSALLHSSTMVKAGVYLLMRISPILIGNIAGVMVTVIGGITFLLMSLVAISQSDGKKILAYSTMANLGLIAACAGIGSYESIWAAMFLVIFHAVAKSLMFLSVGTTEHVIGSRDVEDMHGLIVKLPELALVMAIGIAGMFLAPFGMLISKWAALKAFVDSKNVLIVFFLVYGSSATLFYWTKWLGKIAAVRNKADRLKCTVKKEEWMALIPQAVLTIALCIFYPVISDKFIVPFINEMFNIQSVSIISHGNQQIMTIMLGLIIILPFGMRYLTSRNEHIVTVYMSGINKGDNKHFTGAKDENKRMYLSSWYMENYFGEKKIVPIGIYISLIIMVGTISLVIGGAL